MKVDINSRLTSLEISSEEIKTPYYEEEEPFNVESIGKSNSMPKWGNLSF